ncbi:stimulated by retinoic acid gene 6 protein-like [Amia ocellicauda]|uniref:stimulated by retinoic acid gene 6 protein-like n=1 Tax=Amia ocellicauda TaxID=2972642 RepID=UPI003463CF7D
MKRQYFHDFRQRHSGKVWQGWCAQQRVKAASVSRFLQPRAPVRLIEREAPSYSRAEHHTAQGMACWSTKNTSATQDECADFRALHYWMIPAVAIALILSSFRRRVRYYTFEGRFPLEGRFGLLVPIQLLSTHSNRWAFAVAFGAIANVVLERMVRVKQFSCLHFEVPVWATVFFKFLLALEVALVHYPIFICLTTEHKLAGSLLGFSYTLSWFVYQVKSTVERQEETVPWYVSPRALPVPALLCTAFLILCFLLMFLKQLRGYCGGWPLHEGPELVVAVHHLNYVRRLFQPSSPP